MPQQILASRDFAERASHLLAIGRAREARTILMQALAQWPDDFTLMAELARAEGALGNVEESLRATERAAAADPEHPWPHAHFASIRLRQGRAEAAVDAAARALRINPEYAWPLRTTVLALLELGTVAAASEAATRLVALHPEAASSHYVLARARRRENQLAEAERCLRLALQLEPDNPEALAELGEVLLEQGRREEAAKLLHEASLIDVTDDSARKRFATNLGEYQPGAIVVTGLGMVIVGFLIASDRWRDAMAFTVAAILAISFATHVYLHVRRRSFRLTERAQKHLEIIELSQDDTPSDGQTIALLIGISGLFSVIFTIQRVLDLRPFTTGTWITYGVSVLVLLASIAWGVKRLREYLRRRR